MESDMIPDFDLIRDEYIKANSPHRLYHQWEERDENDPYLHISDLGGCPRKVVLRLLKTEKKPLSPKQTAAKTLMFHLAYELHYLSYSALRWKGLIEKWEQPVEIRPILGLRDQRWWVGAWDTQLLDGRLVDFKTVHPNMLRFDEGPEEDSRFPLSHHESQLSGYIYADDTAACTGLIEYLDRGGTNIPKAVEITGSIERTQREMLLIEEAVLALDDGEIVPPTLDPDFTIQYYGKRLFACPPWSCGYCDYGGHTCKPEYWKLDKKGRLAKTLLFEKNKSGYWQPTEDGKTFDIDRLEDVVAHALGASDE